MCTEAQGGQGFGHPSRRCGTGRHAGLPHLARCSSASWRPLPPRRPETPTSVLGAHPRGPPCASLLKPAGAQPGARGCWRWPGLCCVPVPAAGPPGGVGSAGSGHVRRGHRRFFQDEREPKACGGEGAEGLLATATVCPRGAEPTVHSFAGFSLFAAAQTWAGSHVPRFTPAEWTPGPRDWVRGPWPAGQWPGAS